MQKLSIRIRKFSIHTLANLILYYTLFVGFFIYNFGLPESLLYVGDFMNIVLLVLCAKKIFKEIRKPPLKLFMTFIIALLIISLFSALVYGIDVLLVIWSFRNWGRCITFFLACCCIIDEKQAKQLVRFTKGLFHVNTIVIILQYVFLRASYTQDSLNGLFGRSTSTVNTTFLMIVLSIVLSEFFIKKIKIHSLILYLLEYNVVCIIAELRALIVFEIVFIAIYALVNFKGTVNQLVKYSVLTALVLIGATTAANYLASIYPEFAGFLSVENILKASTNEYGYGFSGYIDRLNFIHVISSYLFKGNTFNYLFGIGMGNAEYSTVTRLCSDFYNMYGRSFAYLRFSSAMIFLESGIVGLVLFFGAYISLFINCIKSVRSKNNSTETLLFDEIGVGVLLTIILFLIYNNVQRTDASFILAIYSAIPFAVNINKYRTGEKKLFVNSQIINR